MLGLFLNPGFLFIAAAFVSVPIIIHLINRMRFKRIHWAAMEFLLKAQKRTRRRLIIEQLILLMLRCLLIALVGLLVLRFIGCGDNNLTGKPSLHLVLLDDTVSMRDGEKKGGVMKNCFDAAKTEILIDKIATALSKTKTNDRLIILPISKIGEPGFEAKDYTFERLNNTEHLHKLTGFIKELQPSYMHVSPMQGVKKVQEIMGEHGESIVTLHLIGDFRDKDWSQARGGEGLTKELVGMVKDKGGAVKLRIIDTADPPRSKGQQGYPKARDNVGITDFYPTTRIAGANVKLGFKIKVKNFGGTEVEARLDVYDGVTGDDLIAKIKFDPPAQPIKLKPNYETEVVFEHRFEPDPKKNPTPFEHLVVKLGSPARGPLQNDGVLEDNVRHAVVEVRDRVPILIVDGERAKGREEAKDSYHVVNALYSLKSHKFHIEFADEISPNKLTEALEKVDLRKYAGIYLLNVPELTPKQVTILENYVNDGGGVAFFLGPLVKADHYNKALYREGKGLFPAPLKAPFYFPKEGEPALEPKGADTFHLLIREDKFGNMGNVPIFGEFLRDPAFRLPLYDMPIRRYFQVDRARWKQEPERVFELATLPNDAPAPAYEEAVAALTRGADARGIQDDKEFAKYRTRFKNHLTAIEELARQGSDAKGFHLARAIEYMFLDKGDDQAKDSMSEFWTNPEPKVQLLRSQFTNLREQVQYGDAFVVARKFGKGKVVAYMSTAGKDWGDFAGGSASTVLYPVFIQETNNYLSSAGIEANLTVGAPVTVKVDAEQFKGKKLSLSRTFLRTDDAKPQDRGKPSVQPGTPDGNQVVFNLTRHGEPGKHQEPGLWVSELIEDGVPKNVLASFAHVFNVDTEREGNLQRVSSDELARELTSKAEKGEIAVVTVNDPDDSLVSKTNDFSESPWLFLMFLFILVAEQALAVHLSFHLKKDDQELQPAGLKV